MNSFCQYGLRELEEQLAAFPFGWESDYKIPREARAELEMGQWELLGRAELLGVEAVRLYRHYFVGAAFSTASTSAACVAAQA